MRIMRHVNPLLRALNRYGAAFAMLALVFIGLKVLDVSQLIGNQNARIVEKIVYKFKEETSHLDSHNLYNIEGNYWKKLEEFSHEDPSGDVKFVVFDSEGFSGSLEFLNEIPTGWAVFVVNNNKQQGDWQMSTCQNCLSFSKSPEASGILEKLIRTQRGIRRGRDIDGGGVGGDGGGGGDDSESIKENGVAKLRLPTSALAKMAAYFFAIQSNAPWIYVTNKRSNIPFDTLTRASIRHPEKGMVYNGPKRVFQPCGHFMDTFTWNGKGLMKTQNRYVLKSLPAKSLYQIVDECYKSGMDAEWQTNFDLHAPVPYVMPGNWAAADFENILIPRSASWTLIASIKAHTSTSPSHKLTSSTVSSTSSDSTDAILSLIVQRLLWETDHVIGFIPDIPTPNSNSISTKCPTCDVETSMSDIIKRKDSVVHALTNWSWCSKDFHIVDCLNKTLGNGLISGLSLNENSLRPLEILISLWIELFNQRRISTSQRTPLTEGILNSKSNGNVIYFTPAKSLHQEGRYENSRPPNVFKEVCAARGMNYSGKIPPQHPKTFENIVVVFSFNSLKFLSSISYLEYMFGRHMKHIIYCASGVQEFEQMYLKTHRENPVSFVEVEIAKGYYGYKCAIAAFEMNYYNVSGYLYLSDDVVLNVWNLYNHPFNLPWFQTDIRIVNLKSGFARGHDYGIDWFPWNKRTGKPAINKSISLLKSIANDVTSGSRVRWFLRNLQQMASGCDNCIAYMDADLFYLPSYMTSDFRFFEPFFQGVFQELSVPTLLAGITPRADLNIYRLRGSYLVGKFKRNSYEKAWSEQEIFVHPVKYSELSKPNPKAKKLYCKILRRGDDDLIWFHHDLQTP